MDLNELIDIIAKKEAAGEIIGLLMLWDNTNIGVHLIIHSELELLFDISVNRKVLNLDNEKITDVNWYYRKNNRIIDRK